MKSNNGFSRLVLLLALIMASPVLQAEAPGGFIESHDEKNTRSLLSNSEIQGFLPERGSFTFPAPYGTTGVRLTNASDCGGSDCLQPVGYSYWRNINNHVGSDTLLVMLSLSRGSGGTGPTLFEYNKVTGDVVNRGPIFPEAGWRSSATGEGWYFSATMPNKLYIPQGAKIARHDVETGATELVLDVNETIASRTSIDPDVLALADTGSSYSLWQIHSSDDDRVHSGTLRDTSNWSTLGCFVYNEFTDQFSFYPSVQGFDECQVDKSGQWLLSKEGQDNRIINLETNEERWLLDEDGAVGHSDMGHGYMIGQDNWANDANTWKLWSLDADSLTGTTVYSNTDWSVAAPSHVSHTNAKAGLAGDQQFACGSSANTSNSPHANEVICFNMDGGKETLVVAPVMTDLYTSGGGSSSYAKAPKGNLDVTGEYFIWTSNMGGSRSDAFIVRVPTHLMGVASTVEPDDSDTPVAEDPQTVEQQGPVGVTWQNLVNLTLDGDVLTKTSGCNGCGDATANSQQSISSEGGYLEFTVNDISLMKTVGLSTQIAGSNAGSIDFAVRMQSGVAEIRELGAYRSDISLNTGDKLRIDVTSDVVTYSKNGNVFYTSTASPSYPLVGNAVHYSINSSIQDAVVSSHSVEVVDASSDENTESSSDETVDPSSDETTDSTLDEPVAPTPAEQEGPVAVTWQNLANLTLDGDVLTKTSGCNGCSDGTANSQESISSDGGYLEFTVNESSHMKTVGLSTQVAGGDAGSIDYGIRMQAGIAEVRELGAYRSDTPLGTGDIFRIDVAGDVVTYSKNGNVFYTSAASPDYPLVANAVFYSINASIKDVLVSSHSVETVDTSETSPDEPVAPTPAEQEGPVAVIWQNLANLSFDGDTLTKTGGCNGCPDATADSQQSISSEGGYLEFTVSEASHMKTVGLSRQSTVSDAASLDFSIRMQAGIAEVRELGAYRSDVPLNSGDTVRIDVTGSAVTYSKNGNVFHTSTVSPGYPLAAHAVFYSTNASIEGGIISGS